MKRFVVVVPDEFCPIGSILVDSHGINDSFGLEVYRDGDPTGSPVYTTWSSLREIDDSAIAAGDEVVAIDSETLDAGTVVTVREADDKYLYFDWNGKDVGGWSRKHFVKVKPLPEVKQEASEKTRIKHPMATTTIGREFWMVKGLGPASYEHADYDSALKEAERLAREHEGVPFTVMQSREVFCSGIVKFDPDFNKYGEMPF